MFFTKSQYLKVFDLKQCSFYKSKLSEVVVHEEILTNSVTAANLNKKSNTYISLYNSSLEQHLAATDHFSTCFHKKEMNIHKTT